LSSSGLVFYCHPRVRGEPQFKQLAAIASFAKQDVAFPAGHVDLLLVMTMNSWIPAYARMTRKSKGKST